MKIKLVILLGLFFSSCSANVYVQKMNTEYLFIDATGNLMFSKVLDWVDDYENGEFRVIKDGQWGILNGSGDWTILPEYEYISTLNRGRYLIKKDNLFGYLNSKGETVIEPQYIKATPFHDKWAVVYTDPEEAGYIDVLGNWMIDSFFSEAELFNGLLAKVEKDGSIQFINRQGDTIWTSNP